jgi:glycosyltransferase involved in cell wall biosynthesis
MTPTLTVLIATHNRADLLERTLRHLNDARRPADWKIDILVAANACSDHSHAMLEHYVANTGDLLPGDGRLPLRWLAEPRAGKS